MNKAMNNEDAVLKALLKKQPQHLRGLARNTGLHPNTVGTTVKKLQEEGFVTIEKDERCLIAFAQTGKAKNRRVMYLIEELADCGLLDTLDEQYAYPTVILFGSAAKGEMHERSDIDIAVISEVKRSYDLKSFEAALGRELHLFTFTRKSFEKIPKELLNNILNGIVIGGYLEVY